MTARPSDGRSRVESQGLRLRQRKSRRGKFTAAAALPYACGRCATSSLMLAAARILEDVMCVDCHQQRAFFHESSGAAMAPEMENSMPHCSLVERRAMNLPATQRVDMRADALLSVSESAGHVGESPALPKGSPLFWMVLGLLRMGIELREYLRRQPRCHREVCNGRLSYRMAIEPVESDIGTLNGVFAH
jgi:hypothetical protein